MICGNCLTTGRAVELRAGDKGDGGLILLSALLGVVGLLFFWPLMAFAGLLFFVGFLNLFVRYGKSQKVVGYQCATCKANAMVPLNSPNGQMLQARVIQAAHGCQPAAPMGWQPGPPQGPPPGPGYNGGGWGPT